MEVELLDTMIKRKFADIIDNLDTEITNDIHSYQTIIELNRQMESELHNMSSDYYS